MPKSKKKRRPSNWQDTIINTAIAVLSLIIFAFIFSFSRQYPRSGVTMDVTFPASKDVPKLAVEIYEENPILDIKVEVLNGCGVKGVAGIMSDFLRENQLDVVRAENADHFEYNETLIIQRNEDIRALQTVAQAMGFDMNDRTRVLVKPDPSLDVSLTVIIGKDYANLSSTYSLFNEQ